MAYLKEYGVKTGQNGYYDITREVELSVSQSGVRDGVAVIFCPHTTAGVTVNENADPDVVRDMALTLNRDFPKLPEYRHAEGNSDAHIKSTLTGISLTLIVSDGRLLLGRWQGVYFAEYDGPRSRRFYVKVLEG
jgi:secondary thiamine-phosphate synthase enzyme